MYWVKNVSECIYCHKKQTNYSKILCFFTLKVYFMSVTNLMTNITFKINNIFDKSLWTIVMLNVEIYLNQNLKVFATSIQTDRRENVI